MSIPSYILEEGERERRREEQKKKKKKKEKTQPGIEPVSLGLGRSAPDLPQGISHW